MEGLVILLGEFLAALLMPALVVVGEVVTGLAMLVAELISLLFSGGSAAKKKVQTEPTDEVEEISEADGGKVVEKAVAKTDAKTAGGGMRNGCIVEWSFRRRF